MLPFTIFCECVIVPVQIYKFRNTYTTIWWSSKYILPCWFGGKTCPSLLSRVLHFSVNKQNLTFLQNFFLFNYLKICCIKTEVRITFSICYIVGLIVDSKRICDYYARTDIIRYMTPRSVQI